MKYLIIAIASIMIAIPAMADETISVLNSDLKNYVFKQEDGKLYWAYETSCTYEMVCPRDTCNAQGDCMCGYLVSSRICAWSDIIPGPLMRELMK